MTAGSFSSRAIAYLKASVPEQDPAPVVTLTGLDAPVFRSLNNGLLVSYVVDTGDEYQFVQYRHLAQDSATEDELHAAGLGNLLALAAGSLRVAPHPKGQMFAVLMGGNFEASLILLDCLWDDSFRQFAAGQYAIAIPARDILAFCDSSSVEGLRELQRVSQAAHSSPIDHPLSDRLYLRMGSRWQVLDTGSGS